MSNVGFGVWPTSVPSEDHIERTILDNKNWAVNICLSKSCSALTRLLVKIIKTHRKNITTWLNTNNIDVFACSRPVLEEEREENCYIKANSSLIKVFTLHILWYFLRGLWIWAKVCKKYLNKVFYSNTVRRNFKSSLITYVFADATIEYKEYKNCHTLQSLLTG